MLILITPIRKWQAHRVLAAWVGLIAVLFHAMVFSGSHHFVSQRAQASPWIEICSSRGLQNISGASSDQTPQPVTKVDHCPYCLSGAGPALLPEQTLSVHQPVGIRYVLHTPEFPIHAAFIWLTPRARAPPGLS